ncbi:MAG TPA: acetyltransferase [Microbacteriaceae bacterium]|jgi:hypothetical protein|nr:acetyltransferase [Microbacteriaceae bacterium]
MLHKASNKRHNGGVIVEPNLSNLLSKLSPERVPGSFVFVSVGFSESLKGVAPLASVMEAEGLSVVLRREDADRLGLHYSFVAAWITLHVYSALETVGLTGAVAATLTEAGISCNMIAGYHHDHILVPENRLIDALTELKELSESYAMLLRS